MEGCRRLFVAVSIAGACFIGVSNAGIAAGYPDRPVRMVVPFPPGGSTDLLARTIGRQLSENLGQQFIIDNRGGAAGNIGADIVAKSTPDGYTMLLGTNTLAINAGLYRKLPFDPEKDLVPAALVTISPNVLMAHPSLSAQNVRQLIDLAKAKPGQLTYASQGNGGTGHLAGELFKSMAQVDLIHVPYKGAGPAMVDLMAGQVNLMFVGISALAQSRSGKLKALAVTSAKRVAAAPDLPTVAESGLAGYEASAWFGFLLPARSARAIVDRINGETNRILRSDAVRQNLESQGFDIAAGTPGDFERFFRIELEKWPNVIRQANVRVE